MTEEQAKQKWCPYVGLVKANEALTGNAEGTSNCIASDCMMWRWHYAKQLSVMDVAQPDKRTDSGYCGLVK